MNAKVAEPRRARENKTLRALASVKEFSELVADDPVADSTNALAKRAGKIVKNCGLPFNESVALLETLFAVVDVATSTKESVVASAVKAQNALSERTRVRVVAIVCAFVACGALYFHSGETATFALACCVALEAPELRAFLTKLFGDSIS